MDRAEAIGQYEELSRYLDIEIERGEKDGYKMTICKMRRELYSMAITALREQEQSKWISVKERLPDNKEHDWVLAQVVEDNGFMHIPKVMEYRQNRNDWFEETYGWLSEHNGAFTVTHWMPLPQPPKEGAEG